MKTFDIITIGNAIIDLFLSIHDANQSLRLNKQSNELCIKAGEKIQVDRCDLMLGGNAANAAVGFSRNGFKVGIVAEIGDDDFAPKIENILQQEMVDTTFIKKTKDAASSMTVGINFQGERTLFVEHVKRAHDFHLGEIETKWIYLTSLGNEWRTPYEHVIEYVEKTGAKLAFNPGTLQVQAGYDEIKSALQIAEILFLNKEEGEKVLSSKYQVLNIKELLIRLQKLGPKVVVVTDGLKGSYAIDKQGNMWFLEIFPSEVIERTGAGDSYASGFLSGIMVGESVEEAMRWGTANASSVVEKVGAQGGLLRKEEMIQKLTSTTIQAKVL